MNVSGFWSFIAEIWGKVNKCVEVQIQKQLGIEAVAGSKIVMVSMPKFVWNQFHMSTFAYFVMYYYDHSLALLIPRPQVSLIDPAYTFTN